MSIKSIAIIGAGWSGLQISKILIDCGYEVKIFEALESVGGTWNKHLAYSGQTIHAPLFAAQFYNCEVSNRHNRLLKFDSVDVFRISQKYCDSNGIDKHISFNTRVISIYYNSSTKKSTLELKDLKTNQTYMDSNEYDLIISTQFNAPRIPKFIGSEKFKGKIYHSSQVNEEILDDLIKNDKNVVIVGGSKSATDISIRFANRNYNVKTVMREMYWFWVYDKLFLNFRTGKSPSKFSRIIVMLSMILLCKRPLYTPTALFLRFFGYIRCPGKKHNNFKKFHFGALDSTQLDTIEHRTDKIYSEISSLEEKSIKLENSTIIPCDVLICATGCNPFSTSIKLFHDSKEVNYEKVHAVYNHAIIPEMPRICFTGLSFLGFSPIRGFHNAAWILNHIDKILSEPNEEQFLFNQATKNINDPFKSVAFDSSTYFMPTMAKQVQDMLGSMTTTKEFIKFLYDQQVLYQSKPLHGVEKFVLSKIKSRTKP